MPEISTKYYAYGMIVAGMLIFFVILSTPGTGSLKSVATILAALSAVLSFVLFKWGYLLIPYLTKRANIIEVPSPGYELTPAQDAVIKKVGDNYYASVFIHIKMYRSTTEKSAEENVVYVDSFERAIASVRFPVKIATIVFAKDISKYREDVETKRYESQLRLQREREKPEPDILSLDRLEKEVAMWEAQLSRITSGERPMGLISYAMTTGVGVTKDAAVAVAKNQAAELKTLLANALNVEVGYLIGEDMKKCFDMQFMIPPTIKEAERFVEE
jgi:hypothetical protein